MRLMTAVATMIAEAIGVIEYREVAAKLGEMVTYTEMWRHAMDGVEHNAFLTKGGLMSLGPMAHDLAVSAFGMRQEVYEYWHGGDPNRNRINLLRSYDQTDTIERIKALVAQPLPHAVPVGVANVP
jgi:aromatic ring hydroxylase